MPVNQSHFGKIFHVLHGESPLMPLVDMRLALANHPHEWKDRPWTEKEVEAHKKRQAKAGE
jgi:hypothetical protein